MASPIGAARACGIRRRAGAPTCPGSSTGTAGKIQIDPLITSLLKLEDINKGFEMMHKGEGIRSVVVF
jgi:hypothetical protein